MIEQLRGDIDAVTAGGLIERWDGVRLHTAIVHSGRSTERGWTLVEQDRSLYGSPREYVWQAWPAAPTQTRC